jgi:hypothetical protein
MSNRNTHTILLHLAYLNLIYLKRSESCVSSANDNKLSLVGMQPVPEKYKRRRAFSRNVAFRLIYTLDCTGFTGWRDASKIQVGFGILREVFGIGKRDFIPSREVGSQAAQSCKG